jgi:hypothetical protein
MLGRTLVENQFWNEIDHNLAQSHPIHDRYPEICIFEYRVLLWVSRAIGSPDSRSPRGSRIANIHGGWGEWDDCWRVARRWPAQGALALQSHGATTFRLEGRCGRGSPEGEEGRRAAAPRAFTLSHSWWAEKVVARRGAQDRARHHRPPRTALCTVQCALCPPQAKGPTQNLFHSCYARQKNSAKSSHNSINWNLAVLSAPFASVALHTTSVMHHPACYFPAPHRPMSPAGAWRPVINPRTLIGPDTNY